MQICNFDPEEKKNINEAKEKCITIIKYIMYKNTGKYITNSCLVKNIKKKKKKSQEIMYKFGFPFTKKKNYVANNNKKDSFDNK